MAKKSAKKLRAAKGDPIPFMLADASGLPDSGTRKEFSTGSVRDAKAVTDGRYDLVPAICMRRVLAGDDSLSLNDAEFRLLGYLNGERDNGWDALADFARAVLKTAGSVPNGLHRVAVLYAKGCLKYGDRNWEKGQETGRIVDSLLRHYGKWQQGEASEDHLAAVVWNVFCTMWTVEQIEDGKLPRELDTYGLAKS